MSRFSAPIAESIWDMKYRLKAADGTPVDDTVEETWRRIARALAAEEAQPADWEDKFYGALEDFKFLPAGRITAGAGTDRTVTLFNCFVMGTIPDNMGKGLVLAEDVSRALRDAQAASMEQLRQVMLTPLESDGEGVSAAVEPAVTDAGLGGRTSG